MAPLPLTIDLPDPDATRRLGRALARALRPGDVVALVGELGAGKTALCKAIVAALAGVEEDDVPSPTFTIACEYEGVLHADAYRLDGPAAFDALGLETGDRVLLVEWADRVLPSLPADRLDVHLEHAASGRRATLRAHGPRGAAAVAAAGGAAAAVRGSGG